MDGGVPASPVPGFPALRVLDQDSSAVVYLVLGPGQRPAVLTVGHGMLSDPGHRAGFSGWAARLAAVTAGHPHLADVVGHGVTGDGRPYLAVRSGADTLATRLRTGGALPVDQVRRIGVALAGALATLHANGLVHGVVRPATVLLDPSAGPALAGFDSAAPYLGAPFLPSAFTPPELLAVSAAPSPAADVYNLAATLYTAVGGRVPWASDDGSGVADPSLRSLPLADVPGVPEGLTAVLRAGLAAAPQHRPTAAALAAALEAVTVPPPTTQAGAAQVMPVAMALLTGAGVRPVVDALSSLGGSAATAAQAGMGAAAAGYQTAAATPPVAGAVSSPSTGAFGGEAATGVLGAPGGGSAAATTSGLGAAKVAVIAVLAAVIGAGAVVAYNVVGSDPPSERAAAPSATPSASPGEPSSAPPTSASPSPTGPDSTVRGAAQTLEDYMHAMGNGDAAGVCKIAAYEFMRDQGGTYESAAARCRRDFSMLFGAVMSESDKRAMRSARVDPAKIRMAGQNRVIVPRSAVTISQPTKFVEEGWPLTMVWNGRHWYPVES